jgi:hypothetical protein
LSKYFNKESWLRSRFMRRLLIGRHTAWQLRNFFIFTISPLKDSITESLPFYHILPMVREPNSRSAIYLTRYDRGTVNVA